MVVVVWFAGDGRQMNGPTARIWPFVETDKLDESKKSARVYKWLAAWEAGEPLKSLLWRAT